MNCGYSGGSGPADWWPYIPPGITAFARCRSAWSAVRGRASGPAGWGSWSAMVAPFRLWLILAERGDPVGGFGCGGAQELDHLPEIGNAGVRAEAGGDQRPARDAEPGGIHRARAQQQAGDHPRVEAVTASGRVDDIHGDGRQSYRLAAALPGDQAAVRAQRDRDAERAQPQHFTNSRNEVVDASQGHQLI